MLIITPGFLYDMIEEAVGSAYITADEVDSLKAWREDPGNWKA